MTAPKRIFAKMSGDRDYSWWLTTDCRHFKEWGRLREAEIDELEHTGHGLNDPEVVREMQKEVRRQRRAEANHH